MGPASSRATSSSKAHARHESAQQAQTPAKLYRDLLPIVDRRLAEEWGVSASWSECAAYGRSVRDWPPFGDTIAALEVLKRHYKLVILSNVDNESFAASNEKLEVAFDAVYTAEDCGSYKPSARNFDYMLAKLATLGIGKHDILHTAESLFHDHVPAKRIGLASCWIHRRHGQEGFGRHRSIRGKRRKSISASTAWATWLGRSAANSIVAVHFAWRASARPRGRGE